MSFYILPAELSPVFEARPGPIYRFYRRHSPYDAADSPAAVISTAESATGFFTAYNAPVVNNVLATIAIT